MSDRVDLRLSAGSELARLGRDLQRAGAVQLKKELLKGMQRGTREAKAAVVKSALKILPETGGLAAWVAGLGVVTQTRLTGRHVGVRIVGTRDKSKVQRHRRTMAAKGRGGRRAPKNILFGKGEADLNRLDRGRARHPTYGHRPWVLQSVTTGFFSDPLAGPIADKSRQECLEAVRRIDKEISKG